MTDPHEEDREVAAAEYALGLLEPDERAAAEARLRTDAGFAEAHGRWLATAATLLGDRIEVPRPSLWPAILARLPANDVAPASSDRPWKLATAAASIAAAILAIIALRGPATRTVIEPAPAHPVTAPLLAVLTGQSAAAVAISLDRGSGQLTLAPARLSLGRKVPELWVIPAGGKPHALGVVSATLTGAVAAPRDAIALIAPGATLAISEEPVGGSPTGQPTGAVILTGTISAG